jgi:hypothetical protein
MRVERLRMRQSVTVDLDNSAGTRITLVQEHLTIRAARARRLSLCAEQPNGGFSLQRSEVISDHVAILHDKPHTLEFVNIGKRIAGDGDEIGKFPRFDRANAILPTEHLGGVRGDGADHIERLYPGIAQLQQRRDARLSARLAGIPPAHVGAASKSQA